MQQTIVPGVSMWSAWQTDRAMFFNSFLVETADGNFVVDPLAPDAETLATLQARGMAAIVLTNRDHERDASRLAELFHVPIFASAADEAAFSVSIDRLLCDGDDVFGWRVMLLDGFKTPGEFVLHAEALDTAISGDAFIGDPVGSLRFLPDAKLADASRAVRSARRVRALRLRHLLVGDGAPVFHTAAIALGACLDVRLEGAVQQVNLDELRFGVHPASPPRYATAEAEIGLLLGAERLSYVAVHLLPGQASCVYHHHTAEEELYLVWEGSPSVRTPRGTVQLRRGDFVALPAHERGAHQLFNASSERATVIILANTDERDCCLYPDSKKLALRSSRLIVRAEPRLDYYDGE